MDYKYINQLLEHYWACETSLEEEEILRTFFSQAEIPAELEPYRPLFAYEQRQPKEDVLGDDFDERMLSLVGEQEPATTRTATLRRRLMPLFRAAAIVAIFLTLGNALQVPLGDTGYPGDDFAARPAGGAPVALKGDSAVIDTLQQSSLPVATPEGTAILK